MKNSLFILCIFISVFSLAQPCPKYGNSTTPEKKKLNTLKNGSVAVGNLGDPVLIPLNSLITTKKSQDRNLYASGAYVYTEGYLVSFQEQGPEACNCDEAKAKLKDGDVHIYIGLKKNALKKNCIVVEITPAFKKKHPDYATLLDNNIRVRITGKLLYDFIHEKDSINYCTSCAGAWRRTCWEIHPITDIERL